MYHDDQADLRTLFQAYSSQIEFSKTQFWRIANYGIWALAATYGLFRAFSNHWKGAASLPPAMIFVVSSICLYNMDKCWRSMREARKKFKKIRSRLSGAFREIFTTPGEDSLRYNYDSWTYDAWFILPVILGLVAASWFIHWVMIRELKITTSLCSWWQLPPRQNLPSWIAALGCFISLALYFARCWSSSFGNCLMRRGRCCRIRWQRYTWRHKKRAKKKAS